MNVKGTAQTEYASLSGKIHTLVIDKTLSISGACADAKATGDAVDGVVEAARAEATEIAEASVEAARVAALDSVAELAEETARTAAVDAVASEVDKAVAELAVLSTDDIKAICV